MASASEQLTGLVLSADEIRRMTGWTDDQMVEDYLTIIRNFAEIAQIVDDNGTGALELIALLNSQIQNDQATFGKVRSQIATLARKVKTNTGLIHAW